MKLFKKDKKLIKKFYAKYDTILCSESLIRSLPRVLGPLTGRITKFPAVYTKNDVLSKRVDIIKRTVKIQMKKVLCIPLAVGNVTLTEAQLTANVQRTINFFVSLQQKRWRTIKSIYIKSTMSKSKKIH